MPGSTVGDGRKGSSLKIGSYCLSTHQGYTIFCSSVKPSIFFVLDIAIKVQGCGTGLDNCASFYPVQVLKLNFWLLDTFHLQKGVCFLPPILLIARQVSFGISQKMLGLYHLKAVLMRIWALHIKKILFWFSLIVIFHMYCQLCSTTRGKIGEKGVRCYWEIQDWCKGLSLGGDRTWLSLQISDGTVLFFCGVGIYCL